MLKLLSFNSSDIFNNAKLVDNIFSQLYCEYIVHLQSCVWFNLLTI